jgi:hypothetical protein
VFERAKEEIEAIVEAILPKKGSDKWGLSAYGRWCRQWWGCFP